MVYILLLIGIALIVYGFLGTLNNQEFESPKAPISSEFDSLLTDNLILEKLNGIEGKIDGLENSIERLKYKKEESKVENATQFYLGKEYLNDTNREVFILDREGHSVEEIASKLGITKGEILLRLGMKK